MSDTSELEPKSKESIQLAKLWRMLRSMLRRYPRAKLQRTLDGFGVSLDEGHSLRLRHTGTWSDAELRDFLVLFATWLVADAEYLRGGGTTLAGYFAEETEQPS
jgi:hypothetical protein